MLPSVKRENEIFWSYETSQPSCQKVTFERDPLFLRNKIGFW